MDETNPDALFAHGNPNPRKLGFWSLRSSTGDDPDPARVVEAGDRLHRPAVLVDNEGYECEIFAAALHPDGATAYVESRAKDMGFHAHGANQRHIDISIRIHLVDPSGRHDSSDIQSYNPFFGCDVRFFEWVDGRTAVLIYREKHRTYACVFGENWPPRFVQIEDRWIVRDNTLGCLGYKAESVRRLTFPQLQGLEPLSIAAAAQLGLLPPEH